MPLSVGTLKGKTFVKDTDDKCSAETFLVHRESPWGIATETQNKFGYKSLR